jgi:ornithine--oxo-acid transaminase
MRSRDYIELEARYGARNYAPIPVVAARAQGVWIWDVEGRRYLDMMSAYSAVSVGHSHPKIVAALKEQAETLAVTSRAFHTRELAEFAERLTAATGQARMLPMNTGAEAVETAIKIARKWGYTRKGIPRNQAKIIVCRDNFHGRTTTIVGFSSEPQYKQDFGPFDGGFVSIPFDDAAALEAAIDEHTCAFLVEPIQGEAGIVIPAPGYLRTCAEICRRRNVLLIADEVQTGFGRTGRRFAVDHEGVKPDMMILGKALGGGLLPVSAVVGSEAAMGVLRPGDHGSTFGGNPLACRVAITALELLCDDALAQRSARLGEKLLADLERRVGDCPLVTGIRGQGLFIALEIDDKVGARIACEKLARRGVLSKETHGTVVRLAPPLVIEEAELDFAVDQIEAVLEEMCRERGIAWRASLLECA